VCPVPAGDPSLSVNTASRKSGFMNQAKITDLKPYKRNARTHSEAQIRQIAKSIEHYGFTNPVLTDEKLNVVAGHGRIAAAKQLGMDTVPVLKLKGMTPAKARAYVIADNKLALNAGWDEDLLKDELSALIKDDIDLDLVGFSEDEISDFINEDNDDPDEAADDVPEVDENIHGVKRGDIWSLGEHRLMCGDSTSKEDVDRLMNGAKADMVFTDPPYGMRLDTDYSKTPKGGKKYRKVQGDDNDFDPACCLTVDAVRCCIWGADWFYTRLPEGFSPIVWDKQPHHTVAGPRSHFELCWVRPAEKRRIIRRIWTGYTAKEKGEARVHPTQKPIDVCIDVMETAGSIVVDLFLGSGSTLIACEKTKRKCYGMEIDPHYCSVIIERWQEYTGMKAVKL
jgi:DNA modification methylase